VGAQLIKGFVMLTLLEVSQFMHHDHLQKFGRGLLEQAGHADFALGLELAALHA
jgi:hypothetical protein